MILTLLLTTQLLNFDETLHANKGDYYYYQKHMKHSHNESPEDSDCEGCEETEQV